MNLNRDFLKTLGGILIIGAIVVATFLYGNQQRQEQVNEEEQAQQQSEEQAEQDAKQAGGEGAETPEANGTGGGTLPDTTPQTGGEVFLLAIPAAGAGAASWRSIRRRRGYTL